MRTRPYLRILLPVLTLTLVIGGCPWPSVVGGSEEGPAALRRFQSPEELLDYFKQQASARQSTNRGLFDGFGLPFGAAAADASGATAAPGASEAQGDDGGSFTTTNIQEVGVDESDVFKSDGTHFYIAKGRTLRVVRAAPLANLAEVAQVDFEAEIDQLYLHDSSVIALGHKFMPWEPGQGAPEIMMWPPYYRGMSAVAYQVDVSDPNTPTIAAEIELDGTLASSRLTDGHLILILTMRPPLPADPTPVNIALMSLEEIMPKMQAGGAPAEPLVPPEDWYRPEVPDGYCGTAVVTLDASAIETVIGSVAVMANAGTIYASQSALYLTDAEYSASNNYRERTAIHKLTFDEDGVAQYVGSGSVAGRLLNQFSLGEHDGHLRVATHVPNWGPTPTFFGIPVGVGVGVAQVGGGVDDTAVASDGEGDADDADAEADEDGETPADMLPPIGQSYNAVYVLAESAGALEVVGTVANIAPGEDLYAARFIGARGFLVTFERIDPLFALDLADPTSPQVVGELKIPGYSDYLHPFGDDLLIGVGRSTGEFWGGGVPWALQLSLFDVSDLSNPTVIEQIEVGGYGSYSDVSYTHKAFTLRPADGMLAIPAQLMSGDAGDGWATASTRDFDGVLCYRVDETGFTELGAVASVLYEEYYWTSWRRAALIDDTLYALTPAGVRAAETSDFESTTTLVLTPGVEEEDELQPGYER